jgi:hypothetical protein
MHGSCVRPALKCDVLFFLEGQFLISAFYQQVANSFNGVDSYALKYFNILRQRKNRSGFQEIGRFTFRQRFAEKEPLQMITIKPGQNFGLRLIFNSFSNNFKPQSMRNYYDSIYAYRMSQAAVERAAGKFYQHYVTETAQ